MNSQEGARQAVHLKSWAAGFIDGEGSFVISPRKPPYLRPALVIQLRSDDVGAIRKLQEAIGSQGYFYRRRTRKRQNNGKFSKPTVECSWASKDDLSKVCNLFDAFPLLGKKRTDYKIWRIAVRIYLDDRVTIHERLKVLRKLKRHIHLQRRFKAS